jgi:hypothetical protein
MFGGNRLASIKKVVPLARVIELVRHLFKQRNIFVLRKAMGSWHTYNTNLSEGEWIQIPGPQPPLHALHHCPLGIEIEKELIQDGSGVETVNCIHHFYYLYPSSDSDHDA